MPWLITTFGLPALTAHLAGATARLVMTPTIVAGAMACAVAVACAGVLLLSRARRGRASSAEGGGGV